MSLSHLPFLTKDIHYITLILLVLHIILTSTQFPITYVLFVGVRVLLTMRRGPRRGAHVDHRPGGISYYLRSAKKDSSVRGLVSTDNMAEGFKSRDYPEYSQV